MKLRNRQKRVSNDIKQADSKAGITLFDTPSSTFNESSAYSFNIKQEDTKNDSSLLQQDDRFEGKDYYYHCDICKKRMPNLKSVLQHRNSTHNIRASRSRRTKDINTEPDIYDPSFYCKPCKVIYKSRDKYRHHLKSVHFMILKTISKYKKPQNAILPDPDDPNLYCKACDYVYARKITYKYHCRYAHGMTSVKFANPRFRPGNVRDTYCKYCDTRLSSKKSYKQHLFAIHKLDWRLIHPKPKNIVPDVDDPNFYCCACERKLGDQKSFKTHLMLVHFIYQSAPKKTSVEPDINDPNNNCSACQKNYSFAESSLTQTILAITVVSASYLQRREYDIENTAERCTAWY
ncbi:hypothetical protein HMPREF1544_01262 [Mucor circinelloides 1006PhL]|uniref:C2H2-type domain-containing protein n=1 Tax=Mucor circinelloides f. circinelloides (strain 1006PhL) TaxID=1220926 RepID=S2K973_MUCC1|nr:hypothetical protein HMPREF1544_01262 [Mucor circinelloides 1006PhL]